jgi:hypothetical protein
MPLDMSFHARLDKTAVLFSVPIVLAIGFAAVVPPSQCFAVPVNDIKGGPGRSPLRD